MAVIKASDADFRDLLQQHDNVVVKYYADWCGNCRLFSPKFKRMSDNEQFADVAFLDVNAEENAEARKAAGVSNLPYFAFFKKGEFIGGAATSKEDVVTNLITENRA